MIDAITAPKNRLLAKERLEAWIAPLRQDIDASDEPLPLEAIEKIQKFSLQYLMGNEFYASTGEQHPASTDTSEAKKNFLSGMQKIIAEYTTNTGATPRTPANTPEKAPKQPKELPKNIQNLIQSQSAEQFAE